MGSPFISSGLSSEVYNSKNPPKDWADVALLVPHEGLRRELSAMLTSVEALDGNSQSWQILFFAEWFVDIHCPTVHSHHDNEEKVRI